jgi:DNA modification methylase
MIDLRCGDCLDVLRRMRAGSVHCCVTSPPYFGLRDYGVDGQIGLERTPEAYVARLVEVFREVRRVLRDDGTLWLNLGDSYATGGGSIGRSPGGGEQGREWLHRGFIDTQPNRMPLPGLKPKDLIGIPWRVAFALQADGWYLRSDIIWHKPNPMPESVRDRPTKGHEYLFLLAKQERYYYDADAISEPAKYAGEFRITTPKSFCGQATGLGIVPSGNAKPGSIVHIKARKNRRTVWTIGSTPYPEAHFATFPPALIEPCILAGTSERGCCGKCGAPWRRVVKRTGIPRDRQYNPRAGGERPGRQGNGCSGLGGLSGEKMRAWKELNPDRALGFRPVCSCPEHTPVPCLVLDPFSGAGTTGLVAAQHGRRYRGIELNPEYLEMSRRRIAGARRKAV